MAVAPDDFSAWLAEADIPQQRLTAELRALLAGVWRFRQSQGSDYYSTRLLSHFLLHADTGLKVAQIARLVGISRPTASEQQNLSSKEVIKQAHHRMDGRPHGKLLPRYAGPIAAYLVSHPDATRAELLDFIERTFGVRVSRIALYKFLKKYGLQDVAEPAQPPGQPSAAVDTATLGPVESSAASTGMVAAASEAAPPDLPAATAAPLGLAAADVLASVGGLSPVVVAGVVVPTTPLPPFCPTPSLSSDGRNMPVPSC